MFFVRFGSFIAWFCTILGSIRVILGFLVAYNSISNEQMREAAQHYLAAATTGEAINEGMLMVAFGVALGLLVVIAKNSLK